MDSRICGGYSDPVNWLRQVEIACSRTLAWAIGVLLPNDGFMGVTRLFPSNLTVMTTAAAIVEIVVATLAGAALYKEGPQLAQ